MEYFHDGTGIIKYDPYRAGMKNRTTGWCVVNVDREVTRYYRYWINKHILNPLDLPNQGLCEPSWNAHISACRGEHVSKDAQYLWKKYDNVRVDFEYSHNVFQPKNKPNFWCVEVKCAMIDQIRAELNLKTFYSYHLTVGRTYNEFFQSTSL